MKRALKVVCLWTVAVLALTHALPVLAAGPDDILGEWNDEKKDAKIEIYKCSESYCGRITWLREPNYPADSTDGTPGTPKLDHNNPDATRTKDTVIGLNIVKGFRYDGENRWNGGTVYDPKNGKTYKGKMMLVSPSRLDLRGYIGISLIGRTTNWSR